MTNATPVPPVGKKTMPLARLEEVERRLLAVEHPPDIERSLSKEWGVTRRTVRSYISVVRRRLAAAFKAIPPEQHAAKVGHMLDEAYRTARSNKDAKGMVAAARTLSELTGTKAPTKVDVTSGGAPVAVTLVWPDARDEDHPAEPAPPPA